MANQDLTNKNLRDFLRYEFDRGSSAPQAVQNINQTYGDGTVSRIMAYEWYARFGNGEFCVRDAERSGRPVEFHEDSPEEILQQKNAQATRELAKCDLAEKRRSTIGMGDLGPGIVRLWQRGKKKCEISRLLKVDESTVRKTIKRFEETGNNQDNARNGRPATVKTPENHQKIEEKICHCQNDQEGHIHSKAESVRNLGVELGISKKSVHEMMQGQFKSRNGRQLNEDMTEISATALIKTGAPISVFSLNSSTVQNTPPFFGNSNCLVNSTRLMPSSSNEPRLQVNRRKGSIPHKLYTTDARLNLDEIHDHAPTYNEYDDSVKLEELYEDEINGLDESSSTFMLHPVQRENGNSSLSEVGKSPQVSSSAKKSKQKSATEVISEKVEPTGLVPFRTRDQHYKKKEGAKYPALVSPLGYEYLRQGTAAVGLDVYVCSKRKTARCQARVNLNKDKSMGEFTHREHNHCSPYFPFNPNSKANPKLRPGEFKTRQEPRKPVINGDAKPEWDEPPGIVHFHCRQSAQKDWRGNASRMLISKKGYEYRRRKVLGNEISEYACNRKNSEPYCSVRLEIRNDENFGVFVLTQHNHPPKYPDNESINL